MGAAVARRTPPGSSWSGTARPPLTEQGRYSGRGDVPLSDEGEAQAMAAAGRVAGISRDVAAVVSSPLRDVRVPLS